MNIDIQKRLKREVMIRVWTVYLTRSIIKPAVLRSSLFVMCFISVSLLVSIPSIIVNIFHISNLSQASSYLFEAFLHTTTVVQIILALAIALFAFVVRDIMQNLRNTNQYRSV